MYNDTVLYREEFAWYHNVSNTYSSQLFENEDGIPYRNISFVKGNPLRYGYLDPYVNTSSQPHRPLFQNWTYLRSDRRLYNKHFPNEDPFILKMSDISDKLGTLEGIQVQYNTLQYKQYNAITKYSTVIYNTIQCRSGARRS